MLVSNCQELKNKFKTLWWEISVFGCSDPNTGINQSGPASYSCYFIKVKDTGLINKLQESQKLIIIIANTNWGIKILKKLKLIYHTSKDFNNKFKNSLKKLKFN